jgi:enoyl-CoA hydratase
MQNILCEFPYQNHKHIALVRLNRPKVLNALSTDLMQELVDCFLSLDKNPDVRVIILTGNERAFGRC